MTMGSLKMIARSLTLPISGSRKHLRWLEVTGEASSATCPCNTRWETYRVVCSFDRRVLIDDRSALALLHF